VSSAVWIPGQSGSGMIVILNFGGAGAETGTCILAGVKVGARAAMAPYVGAAVVLQSWEDTASLTISQIRFSSKEDP
jgi:membrane associated rhomboid family serine protease